MTQKDIKKVKVIKEYKTVFGEIVPTNTIIIINLSEFKQNTKRMLGKYWAICDYL